MLFTYYVLHQKQDLCLILEKKALNYFKLLKTKSADLTHVFFLTEVQRQDVAQPKHATPSRYRNLAPHRNLAPYRNLAPEATWQLLLVF